MIGLSTSCFGTRFETVREQVEAARGLGFDRIEIGISDAPPRWTGLGTALAEFGVKAPVVRAGCREMPRGPSRPVEEIASLDEGKRQDAIRSILEDVRIAKEGACGTLALSGGFVDAAGIPERIRTLCAHLRQGQDKGVQELKEEIRLATEPSRLRHLDRLCRSLFEIARRAPGLQLAIETPRDPHFLPSPAEMVQILEDLPSLKLAYYHDVGAAAFLEILQGIPHGRWLESFAPRIGGMRLHDLVGLDRRSPPGIGQVDWKLVAGYLPRSAPRFLDIDSQHGKDGILGALRFLEKFHL